MAGSFVDQVNQTGVSALGFERHVAVSGISDQDLFATMHEFFEQVRIVHFRGAGVHRMNQAAAGIDSDVGLHSKVPLAGFLGGTHLRISLAPALPTVRAPV